MRRSRIRVVAGHIATVWLAFAPSSMATPAMACVVYGDERRIVSAVTAGDVLKLETGEHVKLVGALPPRDPSDDATRSALSEFALGRAVSIGAYGPRTDRHGKTLGHVFVHVGPPHADAPPRVVPGATLPEVPSTVIWLQHALVGRGLSRAFAYPGNTACLDVLIAAEDAARRARAGLWGSGVFVDRDATALRDLDALVGSFQTVVGRVASIAPSRDREAQRGIMELRFETRSPPDPARGSPVERSFKVWAPPSMFEGSQTAAGAAADADSRSKRGRKAESGGSAALLKLVGIEVRVRGWIEVGRDGPRMSLTDAREIEVVATEPASRSLPGSADPAPPATSDPAPLVETGR